MKAGSWPAIGLIYLYGVLGSASLSKVIPLQADFARHLGASPAQFALLMALLSVPPAFFATLSGSLADRVGARKVLIASALMGLVANTLGYYAASLPAFQGIRLLEGFVLAGVYSSAPALIMATAGDARRGRAMAFWSTYTPVGISLGLLIGSHYTGTDGWRGAYGAQGVMFAVLAVAGLLLPVPAAAARTAAGRPGLLSTYAQPGPLRVALTFGALVVMGLGTNTVFPSWYAQHHGVTVAAASSMYAGLNFMMIVGGLLAAMLLGRGLGPLNLFRILAVLAGISALGLFLPGVATAPTVVALVVWLLASGAATAVVTSSLPRVVRDPTQGAAAAGLLSQVAALTTFVTPQLWVGVLGLGAGAWQGFLVIIALGWAAALLLLPVRQRDAAPATR
jgi:MFS transporter, DHA1 family, inner membrane transport protein